VPLVLPEVNAHLLDTLPASRMVACPGPAAAMVAASLAPLHTRWTARRVVVSTYQSVLDTGREGMDELWSQTRGIFVNDPPTREVFEKQIAFNVLPRVGDTMNSGATTAEFGLVAELKRLIDPRLKVAASCVRVPVFAASGATVVAEFEDEIAVADARAELREAPALMVVDKSDDDGFVTPVETVGEFATFVSRVREDSSVDNGLAWWVTADDLRKGSALLGVEILERLVANGLVRRLG
jgi:aspartate-semialdehyde dehydrogenase